MINACILLVIVTLIRYFLIPKSRDLVSHNPGISGLKNGPGSRDPGIRDPGIAIPSLTTSEIKWLLKLIISSFLVHSGVKLVQRKSWKKLIELLIILWFFHFALFVLIVSVA